MNAAAIFLDIDAEHLVATGLFLPPAAVPVGCEAYAREVEARGWKRLHTSEASAQLHRAADADVQTRARRPTLTRSEVRRIIAEVKAEIREFRVARGLPID